MRSDGSLRSVFTIMVLAALTTGHAVEAAEITRELGRFGEITTWLIIRAPETRLEVDPFESLGGEAKFAAMGDPRLVPHGGRPLEIPGTKPGETLRIGEGVWEGIRMTLPDMPGIWNEFPRLVVPEGYRYAYCSLHSPRDMQASLLTGASHGKCRLYFNGRDLGTFDGGFGFELARELPVEVKQGTNQLLVRFVHATRFACRLIGENAEPLREVKITVQVPNADAVKAPEPDPVPENQKLVNLAKEIPAPTPPEHPEWLGANLARTMALLESGKYTHRPVRIIFDGQSIESGWPELLIQRLRERYPGTKIIGENRAIGGWFVWRMQKLLKHDVLRAQPDLVLFSAYQGTAEVWERFLNEIRSETTADIIIRTQHIDRNENPESPRDVPESILLRRLARKYGVELVEIRNEWLDYLKTNGWQPADLLRDGVHLNRKGETLMALLYERHFTPNVLASSGWADRVRRFHVGRFLADNKTDEIVLEGPGWTSDDGRFAKSNSATDRLRLRFHGTRVDLVLPTTHGKATILIDGKKPSECNLFHGTRPQSRTMTSGAPNVPMTYHTGENMQEETWVLTLTEGNADADPKKANLRVKFRLVGSRTGFDGEGQNDRKFVSRSGRITILPTDWSTAVQSASDKEPPPIMQPFAKPPQIVWHIMLDGCDVVPSGPGWVQDTDYYSGWPYEYVTVADGLPGGIHELTVTPVPDPNPHRAFIISGVDVHHPPLARDVSEHTARGAPKDSTMIEEPKP